MSGKAAEIMVRLSMLALARSGDKGDHANIGVVARSERAYRLLVEQLTAEKVAAYFAGLGVTRVERYELPRVGALNFVLYNALAGGASLSLRLDTQGKLLGTALEQMELALPASWETPSADEYDEPWTPS